ncbi:MAG: hypothetical protein WCT53_02755 [Candidatus Gracilibacteria bacterium]
MHKNRVGLVVGSLMGGLHLLWSILVAFGAAQFLMDWILKLHFLSNPYVIADFNLGFAVGLIALTFAVGYIVGWVLALLWNMMHKK